MGVSYHYCGTCRESLHEDCFRQCHYEGCCEFFEHPCGHGLICEDCMNASVKDKDIIKRKGEYFCTLYCYKKWLKEFNEQAKDIRKCETCNLEGDMNTLFVAQEIGATKHVYCSRECYDNAIRKCVFCNKENKKDKMLKCNFELYCDWKCEEALDRQKKGK